MNHVPKLFLLASLLLAVIMLWPQQEQQQDSLPPAEISEYETLPPDVDTDGVESGLAQSGPVDFVPSEQIGADRAVDFPADI